MLNVLTSFGIVVIIVALGFFVGRRGILGTGAVYTLNMYVYWIALPATLLHFLTTTDVSTLFGMNLAVVALSTVIMAALGYVVYRHVRGWLLRSRMASKNGSGDPTPSRADSIIAMLTVSYCNGSNLGIPLAAHLLGDASVTLPVILFQVGFFGPLSVLMLDLASQDSGRHRSGPSLLSEIVLTIVRNPLIITSVVGIILAVVRKQFGFELPALVAEPIQLISSATIGVALIAFGMSMAETRVLDPETSPRRSVWIASIAKVTLHPLVAWVLGAVVFGVTGKLLLVIVLLAALPTGRNVYTYAVRFGQNTILARDAAVVSTLLSMPVMAGIVMLLG